MRARAKIISMGGATVLMTSGELQPDNARAVVSDCGYSSVMDEFAHQLDRLIGLPAFPVIAGAGPAGSAWTDPALHWGTIDSFLAKYLH